MWPWRGNLLYYLPFLICGMGVITWILPWQGLKWNNYNPKHPKNTQQQGRSVYCGARDFSKHFTSVNLFNVYKQIDTQCIYYYYSIMFHTRSSGFKFLIIYSFPGGASSKEPACQCRRQRAVGSIPGSGRCPGGGHGNPLQYFFLENAMDRGAWWATVHRISKSQTWMSDWACTHTQH